MKRKREEKMNNQSIYEQSSYQMPEANTWIIPEQEENNLVFQGSDDYQPTLLLLQSYVRAQQDRVEGKASPVFISVAEMKKWVDEQNE
jgi:hypothetical protein